MEESYWESMESSIADMLSAGPLQPKAGAITAALFLKHVRTYSNDLYFLMVYLFARTHINWVSCS